MIEDFVQCMNKTCVHDLKPNRMVALIEATVVRTYPLSMKFAKKRWLPFRKIVIEDDSGLIVVKVWGLSATEVLRGQQIQLEKAYCFTTNALLHLTLSKDSHLKICTQA